MILKTQSSKEQYATLVELARQYVDKDNKVSLDFIDRANAAARILGDTAKIVQAGRMKGQLLYRLERLEEAIAIVDSLLPVAKRNKFDIDYKRMLNILAIAYTDKANYNKALEYHSQALQISEEGGNKSEISLTLMNIGLVYYKLFDYNNALEYNLRSLKFMEGVNDSYGLDRLLINIGLCHNGLRHFKEAEDYIKKGLQVCGVNCDNQKIIEAKYGLGMVNFGLEKLDLAMIFFQESLELSKKTNNKRFQTENLVLLAKINIAKGNMEQAIIILQEAEQLANASGYFRLLLGTYKQYSILFNQMKDFENASIYQTKYITLNDSLFGMEHLRNMATAQTNIEERENLAIIDLQKMALMRQRYLNIAITIIVSLVAVILFGLYRRNLLLKQKTEILAEQNREKTGMINIVAHDLRAPLNKIKGLMGLMNMTSKFSAEQQEYINYIEQSIAQGNHLIRDLLDVHSFEHEDSKLEFEDIDVMQILTDWQNTMNGQLSQKNQSILTTIELNDGQKIVTDRYKLIRILDNLLTNASKFSDSGKDIHFRVWLTDHIVNFSIRDQGPGISEGDKKKLFKRFQKLTARPTAGESSSGLGLSIIQVLVSKLGGSIKVNSNLGEGAEFVVSLPEKINIR